jgi:hypothetical protein
MRHFSSNLRNRVKLFQQFLKPAFIPDLVETRQENECANGWDLHKSSIVKTNDSIRRICARLRNEPKTRNSQWLEERFDIWPIFARVEENRGKRSTYVMGNIGEIPATGM